LRRLIQPAGLGGETAEFLGQAGLFLADPLGVVVQPGQEFGATCSRVRQVLLRVTSVAVMMECKV